ncbi:MAG: hypothetical protein MJY87_02550 [Fibrobacter sp.]|nr:hypothetical protein [Fibrobacter sp.]
MTARMERLICTMCSWETEREWTPRKKGGRGKSATCQKCGRRMLRKLCIQNINLKED